MLWRIQLWLATNFGWWRYGGLIGYEPRYWPKGYVRYTDGERSSDMALGTAVKYAVMFGGKVMKP